VWDGRGWDKREPPSSGISLSCSLSVSLPIFLAISLPLTLSVCLSLSLSLTTSSLSWQKPLAPQAN
jgi:hypothetical protein